MTDNILFIEPWKSSFSSNDIEILKKYYNVVTFTWGEKKHSEWYILELLIKKHFNLIFFWFASPYFIIVMILSKLFRIPSMVIVGGWEVSNIPEIGYGNLLWYQKLWTKCMLLFADVVLPVSLLTQNDMLKIIEPKQTKTVYNGINTEIFIDNEKPKEDIALIVGYIDDVNIKRKGFVTFVEAAQYLQEIHFVVIGQSMDDSINYLKSIAPPNVKFTGFVSQKDLITWYQKAKVVCLLSYYEAFGISLAEGMACGCVPVVTKGMTAFPEIVGTCGFYTQYGDGKMTANMIKKAIHSPAKLRLDVRRRIQEDFSIKRRENELRKIINNMLK